MPKISIIIPVYNVIEHLPQTAASALAQTERDIEVILVDDGSTDGSGTLCDKLMEADPRIRVVHKENGGLSSARNAGVSIARGDYILLLDGDDRLHPCAVARTLAVAEQTLADFVQFRYREMSANEKYDEPEIGHTAVVASGQAALFQNLYRLGGEGASACTKLYRRELLQQIPFEPIRHEDEHWCTQAFQQALKAAYIDDTLYDYIQRDGSIIRSNFAPSHLDIIKVCDERICVLKRLALVELLEREYKKLFLAVLSLYRDAVNAEDKHSVQLIKAAFLKHRESIKTYAKPKGKFGLLFRLMCVRFEAAELYRLYWKIRR